MIPASYQICISVRCYGFMSHEQCVIGGCSRAESRQFIVYLESIYVKFRSSLLHYICRSCAAKLKPSISRMYLVAICIFILIFFWSHPETHWWMWEGVCISWHHHIRAATACIRAATLKFTTQLLHTVWYLFFWSNSSIEINGWKSW